MYEIFWFFLWFLIFLWFFDFLVIFDFFLIFNFFVIFWFVVWFFDFLFDFLIFFCDFFEKCTWIFWVIYPLIIISRYEVKIFTHYYHSLLHKKQWKSLLFSPYSNRFYDFHLFTTPRFPFPANKLSCSGNWL